MQDTGEMAYAIPVASSEDHGQRVKSLSLVRRIPAGFLMSEYTLSSDHPMRHNDDSTLSSGQITDIGCYNLF